MLVEIVAAVLLVVLIVTCALALLRKKADDAPRRVRADPTAIFHTRSASFGERDATSREIAELLHLARSDCDKARMTQRRALWEGRVLYALALGLACFALYQFNQLQKVRANAVVATRQGQINACERANDVRRELNRRVEVNRADATNLVRLTTALSKNRRLEAGAFMDIGERFNIEASVAPLVEALNEASETDADIARSQRALRFETLAIIDCGSVTPRIK